MRLLRKVVFDQAKFNVTDAEIPKKELEDGNPLEARPIADFSYLLVIVASFWIFDILPIAVTALIPYVVLPRNSSKSQNSKK